MLHNAIKSITADTERFQFNTAIARIMELVNAIAKYIDGGNVDGAYLEDVMKNLLLLLAPFAPHFCEELWEQAGRPFLHLQPVLAPV